MCTLVVDRRRLLEAVRAAIAGGAATLVDLVTLTALVAIARLDPRAASVPALVLGGVANFVGNRHFAFRASRGSLMRQLALYTFVELLALLWNGLLYDAVLRAWPAARPVYWVVRLVASHVVFLVWSLPLWRRVFRVEAAGEAA